MVKLLHPKILQLKQRASAIQYSSVSIDTRGKLTDSYPASDLEKRIVAGYGVIWGSRNDYGEMFVKGAFAKSISDRGPKSNAKMPLKFLNYHNQREPLSLYERVEENDTGLYFRTVPLDEVDYADRTLISLRNKTVNNFSIGWNYIWDRIEYDDKTDSLIILEAELFEISPVTLASDVQTYCLRNKEEFDNASIDLNDEIELFIRTVPRAQQLELRTLFTRQKSLIKAEPLQDTKEHSEETKPIKTKNRYTKFLIENLGK